MVVPRQYWKSVPPEAWVPESVTKEEPPEEVELNVVPPPVGVEILNDVVNED